MKRATASALALAISISLTAGCSGNPDGAEYFWVSNGARRTYDMKLLIPLAGVVDGVMIVRADGTSKIDGQTYYKTVTTFDGIPGAQQEVSYARLGSDGIYSRKSDDLTSAETLELPLPPEIGQKWSFSQGDLRMEMEVAAIEDCDTAEKTYQKCVRIVGSGTKAGARIRTTSYYAPRIGPVKMSMEGSGILMELKIRGE